jgi:hypothetical protein
MHRFFFPFLIAVALIFGGAYASALLFRAMGPSTAIAIEADGSQTYMLFDAHLPRPEWVPFYPGATIVQAARLTSVRFPQGVQSLDLATRAWLDEVKRFYIERLTAAGFDVTDTGTLSLNPLTAAYLGIAGSLMARRASTDDAIDIQIRTADGLIPSRLLQIHWRKISEFPRAPAAQQAAPAGKS